MVTSTGEIVLTPEGKESRARFMARLEKLRQRN
jgi:hypothetical protein